MSTELALLSRVSYRDQEVTGPRLRELLALLAGDLRAGCSTARLVDGLWPEEQPENPTRALQVLVSRVRSQLGAGVIASTPTGYRLALSDDQVDASAILLSATASAQHSRAGDHAQALAHAEAGLALWQGDAGDGTVFDPVSALRAERLSTYRSLVRARALALSRLGRREEAVEALTDLARERPRDEEVLLELLRCEAATVGSPTALARYDAYRRSLRDDLGTDPGPALLGLHQQLLEGESPAVRHGVPHEPNPLLGRDHDIAAVAGLLRTSRVTSIVGAGGLGKTRLAYVVSRQAEQRVVHLVALAGVTTDEDVVGEVASTLGVSEARRTFPMDALTGIISALGPGPVLLVLDNCEHVIRGAAELVQDLVSMTQDLRVLTTSRAPLGLSSESVYLLPELTLPTTVQLFEQRARSARPGVDLPADAVEELCRHLDGLPLAAELAAARIRVMSVAEITRRLVDRFTLLRGGARDAPQRHRTLHAVVDWSWNLLEPVGQQALCALSIFPGGFTADAAQYLLGDVDSVQVLEDLVDQSLLKVSDTQWGTRFRMLETVREFSTAHREETDGVTEFFLAWARDFGLANHDSVFGADPLAAVGQLRAEHDNLVQALRFGLARMDGATVAATAAALASLWTVEVNYSRVATLVQEATWVLSHYQPGPDFVEVTRTVATLFTANTFLIDGPRAVRSLITLRRLPPAPPTTLTRAIAIVLIAASTDLSTLPALCASDQPLLSGIANGMTSYLRENEGDSAAAMAAAEGTLAGFVDQGTPWMLVLTHSRITELCLQVDRAEEALRHSKAALQVLEEHGTWGNLAQIHWGVVLACLQLGDFDQAELWLERTARHLADENVRELLPNLEVRAEILLGRGEVEAGLRTWRAALNRLKTPWDSIVSSDPVLEPWTLENQAAAVVAHAQHGRVSLVEEIAAELPGKISAMLGNPLAKAPAYVTVMPIAGALLLAVAMVDLQRTDDEHALRSGAQMIALAERFRFLRGFQPTMSAARARQAAEQANKAAYAAAVSSYADLDGHALRAAALSALRAR